MKINKFGFALTVVKLGLGQHLGTGRWTGRAAIFNRRRRETSSERNGTQLVMLPDSSWAYFEDCVTKPFVPNSRYQPAEL